jgi:hypothetical protein
MPNVIPPQAVSYTKSVLPYQASVIGQQPREGNKEVPIQITWATDGGPNKSIYIDCGRGSGQSIVTLSQIQTIYINNLLNDATVYLYFQDTQFLLEIPPLAYGFFPVITNNVYFTAWSPQSGPTDQTYMNILNYYMPPSVVSQFAFAAIPATALPGTAGAMCQGFSGISNSTALLAAGKEGIIEALHLSATNFQVLPFMTPGPAVISIKDSSGAIIYWQLEVAQATSFVSYPWLILAQLTDMVISFNNGLELVVDNTNGSWLTGSFFAMLTYRMPQ